MTFDPKEAIQCSNCNGVGYLYVPAVTDEDIVEKEECINCNGTGHIYA